MSKAIRFNISVVFFIILNVLIPTTIEPAVAPESPSLIGVNLNRIPANSAEARIEFFSYDFPVNQRGEMKAIVGNTPIPAMRISPTLVSVTVPALLLKNPGSLSIELGPTKDGSTFKPVEIKVYPAKHKAELQIVASKTEVGFDEPFSINMTLTNRSPYAVYVTKDVKWAFGDGQFSSYDFEIRPSSISVYHVPKVVLLSQSIKFDNAEAYRDEGYIVKLNPGEAHKVTINDLTISDLVAKSPFVSTTKGRYVLRLHYLGFELATGATSTFALLDESQYSNQIEVLVKQ